MVKDSSNTVELKIELHKNHSYGQSWIDKKTQIFFVSRVVNISVDCIDRLFRTNNSFPIEAIWNIFHVLYLSYLSEKYKNCLTRFKYEQLSGWKQLFLTVKRVRLLGEKFKFEHVSSEKRSFQYLLFLLRWNDETSY